MLHILPLCHNLQSMLPTVEDPIQWLILISDQDAAISAANSLSRKHILSDLRGVNSLHFFLNSKSSEYFPFWSIRCCQPKSQICSWAKPLTLNFNFISSGSRDLLQDQHQLHRPPRPHGSAHRHREWESGNHRALAGFQRLCRRCPPARHPQGSGGSSGAAAKS